MNQSNDAIFITLFKEAAEKCFGHRLTSSLSETDCKLFSNKIFEQTGLVIGIKSIKNYSLYIFENGKKENPSAATLDTFARFVLNAPVTNEVHRKNNESHYPYWFQYKSRFSGDREGKHAKEIPWKRLSYYLLFVIAVFVVLFSIQKMQNKDFPTQFIDHFISVNEDTLISRDWTIKNKDPFWWNQRNKNKECLTLFTLKGDNWKTKGEPGIRNMLIRKISTECFSTEVHISNFFPTKNWQQAGILIAEDSTFTGKMLRLSLSYNDFFGGYSKPPEIIIQGVHSTESGNLSKPEEFVHLSLFALNEGEDSLVKANLQNAALKIEKKGNHFRFLYTTGEMENFAFKEALNRNFNINPKYLGLFAIQGKVEKEAPIQVKFDSFGFSGINCD